MSWSGRLFMGQSERPASRSYYLWFGVAATGFAIVVVALMGSAGAQTNPPASGDWVVDTNTVVTLPSVTVVGNIIVESGSSLTLTNVNLRISSSYPGEFSLIVRPSGSLAVTGGSIGATTAANTYHFEIYGPTTIDGATVSSMWGSATTLRFGIQIFNGNTTIINSVIQNGDRGNILVSSGAPLIRNNTIRQARYLQTAESPNSCQAYVYYSAIGILVTNNSAPTIDRNVIVDNGNPTGFADPWQYYIDNYYDSASCWMAQYYVYEFLIGQGVWVMSARVELTNNTISLNSRVPPPASQVRNYAGATVYINHYTEEFSASAIPGSGLVLSTASGNVTGNVLDSNAAYGILGDGGGAFVDRNTVTNHLGGGNTVGTGVAVMGGITVTNTTMAGNQQAIALLGGGTGTFRNVSVGAPTANAPIYVDYQATGSLNIYNISFVNFTRAVSQQSSSGASVNLWNCTIDASQITTSTWGTGSVYAYWPLEFVVQWPNGAPASNAFAIVTNQSQGVIYADLVGADGRSPFLWLIGYSLSYFNGASTSSTNTPLSIKVFANGTISDPYSFVFNRSVFLTLTIPDPIPPILNIFGPMAGQAFNTSDVVAFGNAFDVGSGMDRVEVSADSTGVWVVSTAPLPGWSVAFSLADGTHDIQIRAYDQGGGFTQSSVLGIVVDTVAPHIIVTQPALPPAVEKVVYSNATGVVLRGLLEDDATLTLNGAILPFSGGGFARQLVLAEGPNIFHLIAVDEVGNEDRLDFIIVSDTIRPSVYISSPVENFATNRSNLVVAGVTETDITLTLNGVAVPTTGGVFSVVYALSEGLNTLTIVAGDRAGNSNSVSRTVHFDTVSPELSVLSPANNLVTNTRDILVQGTVESAISKVYLNGAPVDAAGGQFAKLVRLDEGANSFVLQAWDSAGNSAVTSVVVILDTTPPTLALTAPGEGILVNTNGIRVRGTFSGAASVLVDGAPVELAAGEFDEQVGLVEGFNEIVVTAVDAAGNAAEARVTVYRDTVAPELKVNLPSTPLRTIDTFVEVTGRAVGASMLRVNNELVALDAGGNFTVVVTLALGQNEITFIATDAAGNTVSVLSVVNRASPPEEPQGFFGLGELSWVLLPAFLALGGAATFFVVSRRRESP